MDKILALGSVVLVPLTELHGLKTVRPAEVVRVWGPACANLQVKLDGTNDAGAKLFGHVPIDHGTAQAGTYWATSVRLVAGPEAEEGAVCWFPPDAPTPAITGSVG